MNTTAALVYFYTLFPTWGPTVSPYYPTPEEAASAITQQEVIDTHWDLDDGNALDGYRIETWD